MGILLNPFAGRDVRRIFAQATTSSLDHKRGEVKRAVIGAVAAGVKEVLLVRDLFRISQNAVDTLGIDFDARFLDFEVHSKASDTARAARAMREAGCGAVIVLGGDGTNRHVAKAWRDAPLVPLSTGTNNVFPLRVEATVAGAAAGVVATGGVELAEVSQREKIVRIEIDGEEDDLALVDAAFVVDDRVGNLMPFRARDIRRVVLARAEADAVGMSPIGGLLEPCGRAEDAGVEVSCGESGGNVRHLLAPISPGLYRTLHVNGVRRLALDEAVVVEGPGLLAFDGDRERPLARGQQARLRVCRDGPCVIDVAAALRLAAERAHFIGRKHWHDGLMDATLDCC